LSYPPRIFPAPSCGVSFAEFTQIHPKTYPDAKNAESPQGGLKNGQFPASSQKIVQRSSHASGSLPV
jgi:hypothetical protein